MKKEKRISPLKRLIEWRVELALYVFISCVSGYGLQESYSSGLEEGDELPGNVLIFLWAFAFLFWFALIIVAGCFCRVAMFLWQKIRANSRAVLLVLASVSIAVVLVLAMMWR